jgi:hypothetical protein
MARDAAAAASAEEGSSGPREGGGIIRPTVGNSGFRAGARLAYRRNVLIADHRRGDVLNFRYTATALDVAAAASAWEG